MKLLAKKELYYKGEDEFEGIANNIRIAIFADKPSADLFKSSPLLKRLKDLDYMVPNFPFLRLWLKINDILSTEEVVPVKLFKDYGESD